MTEAGWEQIERRLTSAWPWPALDDERRVAYRSALADLDRPAVLRAIDELSFEHRGDRPSPQTLRRHVRAGAPVFHDAPPSAPPGASTPHGTASPRYPIQAPEGPPGMAVAALALGICSWMLVPVFGSILAIVFGAAALSRLRRQPGRPGRRMAQVGLWLGVTSLAVWATFLAIAVIIAEEDEAVVPVLGAAYALARPALGGA